MISQAMLNSLLLAIFGSVLSFMAASFWFKKNAAVLEAAKIAIEHQKTLTRITDLEMKLQLVNQAVIPISTAFQAILIKELTHAHAPDMDGLMERLGPPNRLTPEEETRLSVLLHERYSQPDPRISAAERDAAFILPAIIRRAHAEAEVITLAEQLKIRLVAVAAVVGVPAIEDRRHPEETRSAEESLKKIEAHTAQSAEALASLNHHVSEKLATKAIEGASTSTPNPTPRK